MTRGFAWWIRKTGEFYWRSRGTRMRISLLAGLWAPPFPTRFAPLRTAMSTCGTTSSSKWRSRRNAACWARCSRRTRSRSMSIFRWTIGHLRSWIVLVNRGRRQISCIHSNQTIVRSTTGVMEAQAPLQLDQISKVARPAQRLAQATWPYATPFLHPRASWTNWIRNNSPIRM